MASRASKDPEKMSYEDAMAELDSLVEKMEQGGMTLEESVTSYARGVELAKACRAKLDAAEDRIRKLDEEGKLTRVTQADLRSDSAARSDALAAATAPEPKASPEPEGDLPDAVPSDDDIPF